MAMGKRSFHFRLPCWLKTSARRPKPQILSSNCQTHDEPATSSHDWNPHFRPPRLDLTPVSPPLAEVPSMSASDTESEKLELGAQEGSPRAGAETENSSTEELGSTVPTQEGSPRVVMGIENLPTSPNQMTNEMSSLTSTSDLNSPVGFPWVGMRNELGFSPVMSPSTSTMDLESSPVMSPLTSATDLESSPVMSPWTSTTDLESSPVMSPLTWATDLDTPLPTKEVNPLVRDQVENKHKAYGITKRSGERNVNELTTLSLGSKVPINFKGKQTEAMASHLRNMVNTRDLDLYKPNGCNGDQARVVKDMEEEIYKFVQQLKCPKNKKLDSVITIIGENIGASMLLGADGDFETSKPCFNSTIQGIDSSMEFNASIINRGLGEY